VSGHPERDIEAVLRERTGRECLFVPSGRLALYLAFRGWLAPGDRLLMSPVTDDVVLFVALAAGLRPVMAPVSRQDGNIQPDAVDDATWSSVAGVLTTNLYGLPDRVVELGARCERHGVLLIEDAAHAIQTDTDGRPVGTFGAVAAFSLAKHVGGVGGVLVFSERARRPELARLRDALTLPRPWRRRAAVAARPPARALLGALGLRRPAFRTREALGLLERTSHRMALRPPALRAAVAAAPGLDAFEPWVRTDLRGYRTGHPPATLGRTLARLRGLDRGRRLEGVRRLQAHAAVAPPVADLPPQPLFRVPLLVEGRDAVVADLRRRGIYLDYIYDPPLDDYAAAPFAVASPQPEAARWWARHVLPVDPLDAGRVLAAAGSWLRPVVAG
jgi:DegT/DnrJ/EryC1/StrS aminotransferase family